MSEVKRPQAGLVVAIDGHSGSGKSTLARCLAQSLGWAYLDSGAWYRALTWQALQQGLDLKEEKELLQLLSQTIITSQPDGTVLVNGHALLQELRTPLIDASVSDVADHLKVREALTLQMQRLPAQENVRGVVADGRDAGSMIFPQAALKVFVEVSLETRAKRRHAQNEAAGLSSGFTQILQSLSQRDDRDAGRGASAPRALPGAKVLKNDSITVEQAIGCLLNWVKAL